MKSGDIYKLLFYWSGGSAEFDRQLGNELDKLESLGIEYRVFFRGDTPKLYVQYNDTNSTLWGIDHIKEFIDQIEDG